MAVTERVLPSRRSPMPPGADASSVAAFQFLLSGTEFLRCQLLSDDANSQVSIKGRMLRPDGEIAPFAFTLKCPTDLVTVTEDYPLGAGALLTVYAEPSGAGG